MEIFVRSGETAEVDAPPGAFELQYAAGDTWYGRAALFGNGTSYNKVDSSFIFSGGSGYTVELYLQKNGNLPTSSMDKRSF